MPDFSGKKILAQNDKVLNRQSSQQNYAGAGAPALFSDLDF